MRFWRFLNHRLGISISQSYLITESLVVLLAGFTFGWTRALYGLVMIYVSGLAAETSSEDSDVFRTALVVTNKSDDVSHAILDVLERGVTILSGKGAYTGVERQGAVLRGDALGGEPAGQINLSKGFCKLPGGSLCDIPAR